MNLRTTIALFSLFITTLLSPGYSQVNIGAGITPEKGAALEIKETQASAPNATDYTTLANSTKGLLFPKVMLQAYNLLTPLYGDPDASSADEKLLATGMVVYNVNPDATGMEPGLYNWNGKEWISMANSESIAEFAPENCESIQIFGTYIVNQPLSPINNYVSLNVVVTKAGSYSMVISTDPNNGYYFTTSGVFQKTGKYTIILPGSGTPATEGQNYLRYSINNQDYTGSNACNKYIDVSGKAPEYSFNCSQISVSTNLTANTAPTINDVIKMRINTPESSTGARYKINSNLINGLRFESEGILTGGSQLITLEAIGTPTISGTYSFTITTNSTTNSTTCTVDVVVVAKPVSMAIIGENSARHPYAPNASVNRMLNNSSLFGSNTNAFYPVEQLNITLYLQDMDQASLRTLLTGNTPPDILFISYNFIPDTNTRTTLVDYVNNGGVLIYATDQTGLSENRSVAAQAVINGIFSSNVQFSTNADGPATMTLLQGNPIVEGMFQDLSGKGFGRDACCNFEITDATLPSDALILMRGNGSQVRSIMHPTKGFVFFGDGGPFSGGIASISTTELPCRADSDGNPIVANFGTSSTPIYNSHLFLNLMAWAIEYVQAQAD